MRLFLLIIICFITVFPVKAVDVEIDGLVLDNTISRFGREFARQFSTLWRDVPSTQGINVQIKELVVPRAGTRLLVNLNNQTIFVTYMGRRQKPIEDDVEQAILIAINAIAQLDNPQDNPDLAGSGW